jgi:hypothetical protein
MTSVKVDWRGPEIEKRVHQAEEAALRETLEIAASRVRSSHSWRNRTGALEPLEQAFSDLLPRGTEVRFDVEGLQRADTKTRYEIHEKAIALGVYDVEHAQEVEGVEIGAIQTKPVSAVKPPQMLKEVV